jgi:hypothetical protein
LAAANPQQNNPQQNGVPQNGVPQNGVPQNAPQAKKFRYWETDWSFDSIDVGNLLRRLDQLGIEVPIEAEGEVTVQFSVSIPLNGLGQGRAYKFSGTLSSPRLRLEQLELTDLRTGVNYDNGLLTFQNLSTGWNALRPSAPARQASGSAGLLAGEATFQVVPRGGFTARFQASDLELAPVFDLVTTATGSNAIQFSGRLDGNIAVSGPLEQFGNIDRWNATANLRGRGLSINDSPPLNIATGPVALEDSRIVATDIRLGSPVEPSVRLAASVDARLGGDQPFEFTLRGNDVPLETLTALAALETAPPVLGKLDVDLQGNGRLNPPDGRATWSIGGRLASPRLSAWGVQLGLIEHAIVFNPTQFQLTALDSQPVDGMVIQRVAANYEIDDSAFTLNDLQAGLFGGTVSGQATVARNQRGLHRIDLTWDAIQPRLDTAAWFPASLELVLRTGGKIAWTVPADQVTNLAAHRGAATVNVDPIALGDSDIGTLQARVQATEGEIALSGEGTLFGGTFTVETTTPLTADTTLGDLLRAFGGSATAVAGDAADRPLPTVQGRAELQQLQLRRLSAILPRGNRKFDGRISATTDFSSGDTWRAGAEITADNLWLDGRVLSRRLTAAMEIADGKVEIRNLRGSYAGGRIDATGRFDLVNSTGRLNLRVAAIDFSRAMSAVSSDSRDWVGGRLSGRGTLEVASDLVFRGAVEVHENEIFQLPTGDTHATLLAKVERDLSSWSVALSTIEGVLGNGRLEGDLVLKSSSARRRGFDMSSSWKARRLDFAAFLGDAGAARFGHGELDGTLVIGGSGIQSAADLTGRFDARLGGTEARAVPGLVATQAYLGAFSLAGTTFDAGRMRGNISGGVVRLDEFWLAGENLRVWADGNIRLPAGRMDLVAVVQTGDFAAQNLALLALLETATLPAGIPVGAVIELNRLVSNRTLYLDVVGTFADPRLRLKPVDTLRENASRLFLRQAAASAVPLSSGTTTLPFDGSQ